jgi:signal peptidase II
MEERKKNTSIYYLIIAILLVLLDQISKILVKGFSLFGINHDGMHLGESISLIGDFLTITFVENPGMAFGIEFGAGKILLSLFSLAASIAIVWFLWKLEGYSIIIRIGVMLILAGALGNFVDRMFYGVFYGESPLFYGNVVDFIRVDIPDIDIGPIYYTHWPVFNFADSYVTVGVILLLIFHKHIPSFTTLLGKDNDEATTNLMDEDAKKSDI